MTGWNSPCQRLFERAACVESAITARLMPPKRRKTKKKRKTKRRAAPRPQIARICNGPLSRWLAQPGESTSALRLTLGEAVKRLGVCEIERAHRRARDQMQWSDAGIIQREPARHVCNFWSALGAHARRRKQQQRRSSSTTTSTSAASSSAAAPATDAPTIGSGPLLTLSPALTSLICGSTDGGGGGNRQLTLTLADTLRRVGNYITRNGLRDQDDRRKIACDAALAEIVGKTTFTIFEAKALLAKHLSPAYLGGGGRSASAGAGGGSSGGAALGGGAGQSSSSRGRIAVSDDEDEEEEEGESRRRRVRRRVRKRTTTTMRTSRWSSRRKRRRPQQQRLKRWIIRRRTPAAVAGVCASAERKRKERPPPPSDARSPRT